MRHLVSPPLLAVASCTLACTFLGAVAGAAVCSGARAQAGPAAVHDAASLRALVPDDAVLVAELADPAAALVVLVEALGDVPPVLRDRLPASAWLGLAGAMLATAGDPAAWAARVAGRGAVFAVSIENGRPVPLLLSAPPDVAACERWWQRFAPRAPRASGNGIVAVGADRALAARLVGGERGGAGRWADADLGPPAPVRGAIDLAALRRALARARGDDVPAFASLDAGARVLLGPVAHAALAAERVRFSLRGGERLALTIVADHSVRAVPFGALLTAPGAAADVVLPPDGLALLRLDRSVRALLADPARFLRDADVPAVQGFLSIADALDGAHTSFVDDLLGGLGEPWTLLVLPVAPPEPGTPPPPLQLPGFALLAPVVRAEAETVLLRVAQALALVANAERAQRGQPLFTVRAHTSDAGRGLVAEPAAWRGPGAPPIDQGLSPTVWCEHGHVVVASTRAAAHAAIAATRVSHEPDAPHAPREPDAGRQRTATPAGDRLVLRGPAWARALATSRGVLELGRVLDEGEPPAGAARFFDVLEAVVGAVHELSAVVTCDATTTTVELALERAR